MKTIFTFFLMAVLALGGYAQLEFKAGPELGYAVPGFPSSRSYQIPGEGPIGTQYTTERSFPAFNPLVGVSGRLLIGKHWLFQFGIQYQLTGMMDYSDNTRADSVGTYIANYKMRSRYHKLCVPLSFGYSFQRGNVRPFFTAGYRFGLLVYGRLTGKYHYVDPTGLTPNEDWVRSESPFSNFWGPTRYAGQILLNVGMEIGSRWTVSVNGALGRVARLRDETFGMHPYSMYRDMYATVGWRFGCKKSTKLYIDEI